MNALVFFLKRPLARVVRGEKINETKEWGRGAGGGPEVATTAADPTRWLRVIEPDENSSPPPQTRKRLTTPDTDFASIFIRFVISLSLSTLSFVARFLLSSPRLSY